VSLQRFIPHLSPFHLLAHYSIHGVWHLDLRARRRSAACPGCRHCSTAVHSAYRRTVADMPIAGAQVLIHLYVRRFFCRYAACPRRIFAERFPTLAPVRGRHSLGVRSALRQMGLAVGGRAGARLAHVLGIAGSYRTIVRLVHCTPFPSIAVPRVIGLDEWAWRRGRRFGTIVCDLERHQVLDLLPERSAPSVAQWLQAHPSVEVVCRDRSRLYAEGIRHGAPQAVQVVDRFHLVQNLGEALERFFLRYRRALNTLDASLYRSSEPTPALAMLSRARHTRRARLYHQIRQLSAQQLGIAAIAAGPGQSPHRLPVPRHAPAASAAAVTPSWAAPHRALHPVSATAVERRLSERATALAGARGARPPAGAADRRALRRPTAAGDRHPVQVSPRRAGAPLCREP
jgi:Transposase/zinc-finger of transposase IS204/IS1001/IS1096/IS1165